MDFKFFRTRIWRGTVTCDEVDSGRLKLKFGMGPATATCELSLHQGFGLTFRCGPEKSGTLQLMNLR